MASRARHVAVGPGLTDEEAGAELDRISAETAEVRGRVEAPAPFTFTLTGRSSPLRWNLRNNGDEELEVVVRASSPKLTFPEGNRPRRARAGDGDGGRDPRRAADARHVSDRRRGADASVRATGDRAGRADRPGQRPHRPWPGRHGSRSSCCCRGGSPTSAVAGGAAWPRSPRSRPRTRSVPTCRPTPPRSSRCQISPQLVLLPISTAL